MENNKPISIILDDLKNNIANQINQSGLQPCLVEPVLKDLYEEVRMLAVRQLEQDKQAWEQSQQAEGDAPPADKEEKE